MVGGRFDGDARWDCQVQEVRDLLSGYLVHSVQITPSNGTARVLLAEPEVLETWAKSSQHTFRGHKVTISPSNTEGLLCVSRLPLDHTEEDFAGLVGSLGEVSYCFLMRSEKTGESKGYGFVEYVTKEVALQAKSVLDGRETRDTVLVCDWLDPSHVTFASLHSTCLYVDQLPKDYRDMGEFRRIFSKVTNPPYCQIAMRNGALQDWGLVEFINAEDAEETQSSLHNYVLRGQRIRVQYCIPGVRAINIYMKILSDPGLKKKSALLPEPPANKVFSQLQNLTKHNPAFATSLQNIILTQIQSLGVNPGEGGPPVPPPAPGPPRGPRPPTSTSSVRPPQPPPRPASPSSATVLNTNAQAALVILLAAQMQLQQQQQQNQQQQQSQQQGAPSGANLLASPHVLNLLQSLVQQGDPQATPHRAPAPEATNGYSKPQGAAAAASAASMKPNYRNGYSKNGVNKPAKTPLLPTPGSGGYGGGWEEGGAGAGGGEGENGLTPLLSGLLTSLPGLAAPKATKDDLQGTISTLLSNAHSLQQLLGTLTANEQPPPPQPQPHPQQLQQQPQAPPPAPPLDASHAALVSAATLLPPPHISTSAPPPLYPSSPLMSMLLTAAAQPAKPALLGDGPLRPEHPAAAYIPAHLAPPPMEQPPPPPPVSSAPAFLFASPVTSRVTTSWSPPPMAPPPALLQPPILHPAALPPHPRLLNPLYLTPTKGMAPPAHSFGPAPPHAGYTTPIGHKRKSNHILPSPEPSPENGYVGQHSQGIGGHYQDSYLTKKLKKH
ncbi:ribonucleoprotein PTB-binding 1-like [Penaeus indicus]|uniref:ribonucleoprotein PTB-binding 1-like n=1 Tax=Penaeus indicus TaxID=29960 RepID=UPI00300CCD93